jgi:hypothetical protein
MRNDFLSRGLGQGWIDADPTLVGIVIFAVVLAAVVYVIHRVRGRTGGG